MKLMFIKALDKDFAYRHYISLLEYNRTGEFTFGVLHATSHSSYLFINVDPEVTDIREIHNVFNSSGYFEIREYGKKFMPNEQKSV